MTIVIDEKFRDLIPRLTEEEYEQLEANIRRDGCLDPLRLWKGRILIDGHHRLEICRKWKKPYQTVEIEGLETEDHVKAWILSHQLGKRNLNPDVVSYLRGKLYEVEKRLIGRPEKSAQNAHNKSGKTADRMAEQFNVNQATVRRDADFAKSVDMIAETAGPEAKQLILSGEARMTRSQVKDLATQSPDKQQFLMAVKKNRARAEREHRQLLKDSDEDPEETRRKRQEAERRAEHALRMERFSSVFVAIDRAVIAVKSEATIEDSIRDWEAAELTWLAERVGDVLREFTLWEAALARRGLRTGRLQSVKR